MAALGDIGRAATLLPFSYGLTMFGRNQTVPGTVLVDGIAPNTVVFLFSLAGAQIDSTAADMSGEARFYDLDNGAYTVYSNNTGDVWRVTIIAGAITVSKLFTSNRATARGWVG